MPVNFDLYYAALEAEKNFHAEVVRQFGPTRAGDMRYQTNLHDSATLKAGEEYRAANEAWRNEMRRDNENA